MHGENETPGHPVDDYLQEEHVERGEEEVSPFHDPGADKPVVNSAQPATTPQPSSAPRLPARYPSKAQPSHSQAPKPQTSAKPTEDESKALLARMKAAGRNIRCTTDLTLPLPFKTLDTREFSVAMRNQWLFKDGKQYFFTEKFASALEAFDERPAPRQVSPAPAQPTTPVQVAAPPTQPDKLPFDPRTLPTVAHGSQQLKIEAIVYRETNKINQPQIKLIGQDGEGQHREIWNGIPLATARMMLAHHTLFEGKVVLIDDKGNFVGIPLNPVAARALPPPLPLPLVQPPEPITPPVEEPSHQVDGPEM